MPFLFYKLCPSITDSAGHGSGLQVHILKITIQRWH